jgi:vitamin K-dependent gamma-carboxylase-like protein
VSGLLAIDLRSLALFRVCLGALLVADLLQRSSDLAAHYTDAGVLPRVAHEAAFGPVATWSIHLLAGTPFGQSLLFLLAGAAALALAAGLFTRTATLASWLLLVSLHHRQPLVLTGGDGILALLLFWSLFLPLSSCWSLDARRARAVAPGPRLVRSAAAAALLVQVLLVYLFAGLFKLLDPSWQQLSAVEESFGVEGVATDLARTLLAASLITPTFELVVPWLAFFPWRTAQVRTGVVFAFFGFHLLGTGGTLDLGLIGYVMATAWTVFLPAWFWEVALPGALARLRAPVRWIAALRHPPPSTLRATSGTSAPRRALGTRLRETTVWLLLAVVVADNLASLDRRAYRRWVPEPVRGAIEALGLFQNWRLWSTPIDNRYYVFAARLHDGSEVDLHTGEPLDWSAPRRRSRNNHWWKYQLNLSRRHAGGQRPFYAAWLAREWNRRHAPERWVEELRLVQLSGPWTADPAQMRRTLLWP